METRILTLGDMDTVQVYNPRISAAGGDWWDPDGDIACVWAAYQPKGAASLAASYTDLSGNGNNAGVGVAPTWDMIHWTVGKYRSLEYGFQGGELWLRG